MPKKETVRLETGMMDQIMLVFGKGPVETWEVLRVWHTSQREEAESYLQDIKEVLDYADQADEEPFC